jgi:hypothetical protein
MKLIIRLLTALCLALALLWGAIMTATSDRAALFFKLAKTQLEESEIIEKTKDQFAHTLDQVKSPGSEPAITEELIEDRPIEITPVVKIDPQIPTPEATDEIPGLEAQEFDPIEEELLAGEKDNIVLEQENDVLSSADAIRILETLNIGKE